MRQLTILIFIISFCGCRNHEPLQTVSFVDLKKYSGRWYEIARLPQRFQKGCVCTTADYLPTESEKKIKIINQCRNEHPDGKLRRAEGVAKVVENSGNSKLSVSFFWPFYGKYWIIALAGDYSWAVVGHPNRKSLWILSRNPTLDPIILNELKSKAMELGFNTARLIEADPQGCNYENKNL
jgi:apolipoprotein D and lipocalin family protein